MNHKEFSEILKQSIEKEIKYHMKELKEPYVDTDEQFCQGEINGLIRALKKIERMEMLVEKEQITNK